MSRCTILVVLFASTALAAAETRSDLGAPALEASGVGIIGGSDVPTGKWPDTVAVLGANGVCTGTLIAPDVVLTAGHCADINPSSVVANTINYAATGGIKVGVTRTVAYPNWENTFDVAIVILSQPINGVTPRRIGTSCTYSQFAPNTMVRLVGFGATDMEGAGDNTQLKEAMTAVTDPMCSGGNGCNTQVAPGGEFIAGGTGSADSCFGDSGGPVYLETSRGPIVVGAVSRGVNNSATPCGGGGIYVRTDKIVQWIEETAGKAVMKDECVGGPDGTGTDSEEEALDEGEDVIGGCSTTGAGSGSGSSLGFAALALGFAFSRRRRRALGAKPAEAKPAEDPATLPRR